MIDGNNSDVDSDDVGKKIGVSVSDAVELMMLWVQDLFNLKYNIFFKLIN